ncbi:MAG: hypothetical protein LBV23_07765 [Deltaproteobacteria bacterium]|nr:hypothetical protein [Deltaproteobacteria bacterium]
MTQPQTTRKNTNSPLGTLSRAYSPPFGTTNAAPPPRSRSGLSDAFGARLNSSTPSSSLSPNRTISSSRVAPQAGGSKTASLTAANQGQNNQKTLLNQTKPTPIFSFIRLAFIAAAAVLIVRLIVSGLYLQNQDQDPLKILNNVKEAQAAATPSSPVPLLAPAAIAPSAISTPSAISIASDSSVNSMASGAALFMGTSPALVGAQTSSVIPLPPGDEDLRLPQKTITSSTPAQSQGPATSSGPERATIPALPPTMTVAGVNADDLAKREFEIRARENALKTREEAIKKLEGDLTIKINAAEKSKTEMNELINRNQAILEEQKALREQQKKDDQALKDARVEHLVTAFKGMKPEQAGALINSMDDSVAVAILSAMPGSNAGKILAMVVPEKAARLVKAISEQKIDPKVLLEGAAGSLPPPAQQ